jgi:hypothetical protein
MPERLKCIALGFVALGSALSFRRHVELPSDPFRIDRSRLRGDCKNVARDLSEGVRKVRDESPRSAR